MAVKHGACAIAVEVAVEAEAVMPEETSQAVTVALYDRLTTDATLKATLGGTVRLHLVMAPQDADMPYLVHRLDLNGELFLGTNTYLLDLWDYNESPERLLEALDRIKVLLHEWGVATASSEIGAGRMEWFSGAFIPTDGERVWHYATQWSIRFGAVRDRASIVG